MRWGLMLGVCAIAGCAGNQLASTPPAGVDLSGHWNLNLADSEMRSASCKARSRRRPPAWTPEVRPAGGGRQRGRGGGILPAGPGGPVMPSVSVLDESLRWPGKDLTIEQTSDRVTFTSDGGVRFCRPSAHGSPTTLILPAAMVRSTTGNALARARRCAPRRGAVGTSAR